MEWYVLIFVAVVIEALITYGKMLFKDNKLQWQIVASMILGILCAIAFRVDLFAIGGITCYIPYVGMILTGILLSRGSNYLFDLIKTITGIKNGGTTTNIIASPKEE